MMIIKEVIYRCQDCGTINDQDAKYCKECGKAAKETSLRMPDIGMKMRCSYCNKTLSPSGTCNCRNIFINPAESTYKGIDDNIELRYAWNEAGEAPVADDVPLAGVQDVTEESYGRAL